MYTDGRKEFPEQDVTVAVSTPIYMPHSMAPEQLTVTSAMARQADYIGLPQAQDRNDSHGLRRESLLDQSSTGFEATLKQQWAAMNGGTHDRNT